MRTICIFIFSCLLSLPVFSRGRVVDCTVAQDGTGDFATIGDAIDAAPTGQSRPYIIFIKAGHYREHIYIPADKPWIFLVGEGREKVRVSDDRVSGGPNGSPVDVAATLVCHATDCCLTGMTFENSWGTRHKDGPQALALYTKCDRTIVNDCAMLSYQDTYRTANTLNARNYVKDCFIEGAVDFIYGQGNVFFDSCTLNIVSKDGGFIVAPKHETGTTWGYVLRNTTITAPGNPSETSVWLGRPWRNAPKAVFIDTRTEVTIPEEGWFDHMGTLPEVFAEHNTADAAGNKADLDRRISMYYKITQEGDTVWGKAKNLLTADEAARHTVENVLGGDDSWKPEIYCKRPEKPVITRKKDLLRWTAVSGARGYAIRINGKITAFTEKNEYPADNKNGIYDVITIGRYGCPSK